MPEAKPTQAKYVFLDVVNFTHERSIEDQTEIVRVLNGIVVKSVDEQAISVDNRIFLPTGDGICIALINIESPYDIHLQLALSIVKGVHEHNESSEVETHRFEVRIGVNANTDNLITDINGKENMAGAGINIAQRIMSLAEGNQIFVGQSVFDTLQPRDKYIKTGSFRPYHATAKHDLKMKVYQYVADGHPGLNTSLQDSLKKEEATNLFKAATACGLKRIYHSRDEITDNILRDIENARSRIWLLGVGLSEKINLSKFLPKLEHKIKEVEVRILLLDAFRSPALFRTFLEINWDTFRDIINTNRSAGRKPPLEPYFQQQLYRTFHDRYSELNRPIFNSAVRFYRHTPIGWLVIIDNTAYFQPYTFGRGKVVDPKNLNIGHLMPIFKFEIQDDKNSETFSILEDHFNTLWLTSNTDLLHIGTEMVDSERILQEIFAKRNDWFKHVYGALHGNDKSPGKDRRIYPRKSCKSSPPPSTTVEWEENETPRRIEVNIIDFSREGILLELVKSGIYPDVGVVVTLKVTPVGTDPNAIDHLKKEFLEPSNGKFKVTRVLEPQLRIALQVHLEH